MQVQVFIVFILFRVAACQVSGEEYGVVSLRPSPSDPVPLYSTTLNAAGGFINVTLLLYDAATNTPTLNGSSLIDEDVLVECSVITPYQDGDSRVEFFEEIIPSFAFSGSVNFQILEQGRAVEVQCRGKTSPTSTGTTSYFNSQTSAGPTGSLVVKKSPVVSFCEPMVLVPNSGTGSDTTCPDSTVGVIVELSEPVADFPVTVSCAIVGVRDANNSLMLNFQDTTVQPGAATDVIVEYCIVQTGDIVQVACSAESIEGSQFMQNTSQGELAIFSLETGSVSLIPPVSDIQDRSLRAILSLGAVLGQSEGAITYSCYVDPVSSPAQAEELVSNPTCITPGDVFDRPTPGPTTPGSTTLGPATTPAASNATTEVLTTPIAVVPPTTTPVPPLDPTSTPNRTYSPWQLQHSEIVFQAGDVFKELVVTLDPATPSFRGAVLVSCCAPQDINSNTKYINTSDALLFFATVQEDLPINWTIATDFSNRFMETVFPEPAYVDLAPCPCDMTAGHCDTECCCDEDCSAADVLVFSCAIASQDTPGSIYSCGSRDIYRADYAPLLCVQQSNSPYLGLYQSTRAATRDVSTFSAVRSASLGSRDTSYRDIGRRSLDYTSPDTSQYSNGDPLELLYDEDSRGFLSLPQMTLSGECLWTAPVQFQEDMMKRCTLPPQQKLCQSFSPLSALMFLRSSTEGYPPCPKPPAVASHYGQNTAAPTEIEYYCLADVADYLRTDTNEDELFPLYESALFPDADNATDEDRIPERCAWDDGFTQPPTPLYDNDTNLCYNSVVSVSYEMLWRGGEIIGIRGSVILGAIPLIEDSSLGTDEEDVFVPPPPTTAPPPTTTLPTTALDLSTIATDDVTIITDVTVVLETVITDVFATDNTTSLFMFEDVSTVQATSSGLQSPIVTTPVMATTQAGSTAQPPTTVPLVTTPAPLTSPAAPNSTLNVSTTMSPTENGTAGIQNGDVTTDMPTDTPMTTPTQINTTPTNITLLFSTTFTYLPETITDPLTGQTIPTPESYQRSGNPGYVIGKPLLSGVVMQVPLVLPTTPGPAINCTEFPSSPRCVEIPENETVYVFDQVDTSFWNQLKVFSPGDGSLCSMSSTAGLSFGQDVVSGCILRMGQSELQNCSILGLYLEEQLRALVPADRVGKRGNSSELAEEDWAEVFNPDDHPYEPATTPPPTTETMETTADPLTTLFPGQQYIDPEPPINPVDQLLSTCPGVPTSVNMEVLIAEAGVVNGVPQYEVLAASIQYHLSTLRLSCSGAQGASCFLVDTPLVYNTSGDGLMVQSFPVYSTVTFTTVPAQQPPPVILYYKDYDPSLCKQDTCLSELLYPFTGSFQGDPFPYSLGVAMVCVVITTAYFIVTSPCAHL